MSHCHPSCSPATAAQRARLLRAAYSYHQKRAEAGTTEWAVMVRAVEEAHSILEARQARQEQRLWHALMAD